MPQNLHLIAAGALLADGPCLTAKLTLKVENYILYLLGTKIPCNVRGGIEICFALKILVRNKTLTFRHLD
jgi:hypothetical protein